jgi:hypothetical protein
MQSRRPFTNIQTNYPDSGLSAKIEYEIDVIWEITVA